MENNLREVGWGDSSKMKFDISNLDMDSDLENTSPRSPPPIIEPLDQRSTMKHKTLMKTKLSRDNAWWVL